MSQGRLHKFMDFMMNVLENMDRLMSGDFVLKSSIFYLLLLLLMIVFFACMEDYHHLLIHEMKLNL